MKAIVLCAGKGTRLRPLTFTNAKPLIPVANKPTIMYSLEMIKNAGIVDVGIIVNPDNKKDFEAALGDGSRIGLNLSYHVQAEQKGLAHAASIAQEFIGEDTFLMYLGDNMITVDLGKFIKDFEEKNLDSSILLTPVEDPSRFGIAVMEEDKVVRVVEKPKEPPSNLAIVGVYIFKPMVFEGIKDLKPSARGEYEITDAIQWMISSGKTVGAKIIKEWWKDTGKPEDLIEANRVILETFKTSFIEGNVYENSVVNGNVHIGKNSKIMGSIVRGPVIIGENCTITNAFIGPYTSVGNGANIEESEIENSIILDNARISNLKSRIDSSIIGAYAKITSIERKPNSIRFVIGDYGNVEIPK